MEICLAKVTKLNFETLQNFKTFQNFSIFLKTFSNFSKLLKTFSKLFQTFQNISKLARASLRDPVANGHRDTSRRPNDAKIIKNGYHHEHFWTHLGTTHFHLLVRCPTFRSTIKGTIVPIAPKNTLFTKLVFCEHFVSVCCF